MVVVLPPSRDRKTAATLSCHKKSPGSVRTEPGLEAQTIVSFCAYAAPFWRRGIFFNSSTP